MAEAPKPAEILGHLEPVTAVLRSVLRKSVARARRFLLQPGREWDAFYFATRIRFEARQLLKAQSLDVSEDSDESSTPEVESNKLPNIGLQFFRDGVLAKVLKRSTDPDMPLPIPASRKRIGLYNQQRQFIPHPQHKEIIRLSDWNAIYLWDCNEQHHLASLALALPRTGGRAKADVSYHWIVDIPILSTIREPRVDYGEVSKQQTLIDDVDIRLPEDETETGTNDAP